MVKTCTELFDWTWSCDVSNLQTMTVEIIFATILSIIAVIIAIGFYYKEKTERKNSDKIIKDARDIINKIKPTIEEQQQRFDVEAKDKQIRWENTIDEIRFWIKNEKQFFLSIKDIFENEHTLTDAVEMIKSIRHNPILIERQMSSITEKNRDVLTEDELVKIDKVCAKIRIYLNSTQILNVQKYSEYKTTFPLDMWIEDCNALLNFLPDTRPMA